MNKQISVPVWALLALLFILGLGIVGGGLLLKPDLEAEASLDGFDRVKRLDILAKAGQGVSGVELSLVSGEDIVHPINNADEAWWALETALVISQPNTILFVKIEDDKLTDYKLSVIKTL